VRQRIDKLKRLIKTRRKEDGKQGKKECEEAQETKGKEEIGYR